MDFELRIYSVGKVRVGTLGSKGSDPAGLAGGRRNLWASGPTGDGPWLGDEDRMYNSIENIMGGIKRFGENSAKNSTFKAPTHAGRGAQSAGVGVQRRCAPTAEAVVGMRRRHA